MRGIWKDLPFDPTPIADCLRPHLIPKKKPGYFPKGTTFALSRRVEKALAKELKNAERGEAINHRAYRYAVHRAFLTLFHEEHSWDDSYGVMGDLGKESIKACLGLTPDDLCIDPKVFLKDLLMFLCWEDYGLSDSSEAADYIAALSSDEGALAVEILRDIQARAAQGFQDYYAENARRILMKLGTESLPLALRVVSACPIPMQNDF